MDRLAGFCDGTAQGLRTIVEIFLSDVAETIDGLAAAVAARHGGKIELLAHRAGGASAACGAARLAMLLLDIEEDARSGATARADALMREVTDELGQVTGFLQGYLDGRVEGQ
jgi:HPt (histidine-containing phosphotransfer) domain-containing protein